MTDVHDMRHQMSQGNQREKQGNMFFWVALAAIPVIGLLGGIGWKMSSSGGPVNDRPVAAAPVSVPEEKAVDEKLARLSTKEKWLRIQAVDDKFLAAALQVQEEHPVALKIHQYGAVTKNLARCADFTNAADPVLFLIGYYGDLNEYKHKENLKLYKSSGADKAVLKNAGRKIAREFLMDRDAVSKMFEQVQKDLQGVPIDGTYQKTPECQAIMKLVKSAKMNL